MAPKYLIFYTVDQYFQSEGEMYYRPQGHSLILEAENKVEAFISAYEYLTSKGHMVCTVGPFFEYTQTLEDGSLGKDFSMAGLSSEEMQQIYASGVPFVGRDRDLLLTNINDVQVYSPITTKVALSKPDDPSKIEDFNIFVDITRINELRAISSSKFDLSKLIRFCEELNVCYSQSCYLSVAMLTRAIIDHVPPIFGFNSFTEVANNYPGTKSFRESIQHLQNSSRKISDAHLHSSIRQKEILPTKIQINFAQDLDVLLAEIVRLLK